VGTIERLKVIKDQVEVEKEDVNVKKVTKDQIEVEKGDADVAKATKVGFEVENEGTKVQPHRRLMMPRKVGMQQMLFMMGGHHKGRGVIMG